MNDDQLTEPKFPIVAVRAFANALSFFLTKENEGIVCQGENEDGRMQKFIVWKHESQLRIASVQGTEMKPGDTITMHESKEDAITAAAISNDEFLEI